MPQAAQTLSHQNRIMRLADQIRSDDWKLLELGHQATAIEKWLDDHQDTDDGDPEFQATMNRLDALLQQIEGTPATTAAGLRVKAERVLQWRKAIPADMEPDADMAIALSIVRDVMRA